ncbi:tumor necrosis factor receptor superfamily member 5 isoform X2 [Colossoma macropomum]|uniref:tumor necrosis factor receptor superfamily member 5 isoform X2 n=1 Tax=Colossoma macropomum TaxID=42526 RepID=UPI001863FDFA|nr:tumor necrosis factor receptor superfamily member 5 isoform X2 [Colossoma macropomum]
MLIQWCCLLLLTPFLSLAKPLFCDGDTEYEWPRTDPTMCCKKCPPGEYLTSRCTQERETQCEPCGDDYYTDTYNFQLTCFLCTDCTKENMKYNQTCTPTRNAVCDCKSGYICNSEQCGMCVEDPAARTQTTTITTTTIKPPLPTKTGKIRPMTTDTKTKVTSAPYKDTHLQVDGRCLHHLFAVFGTSARAQWNSASARRRRRCQCRSRRCAEERRSGRRKSERDGLVRIEGGEGGRRFHMRVWVEYEM